MPRIISGTLIFLAVSLSACSSIYRPPHFSPPDATFPGLVDFVEKNEGRNDALDVFLVHGMCTHDKGWAEKSFSGLAKMLRTKFDAEKNVKLSRVPGTRVELYQTTFELPRGFIRANAIVWSPLTSPLKQQLCYDQSNKSAICENSPPYEPKRATANALAKDILLNDCLSDALVYEGKSRLDILRQMQEALTFASATSGGDGNFRTETEVRTAAITNTSPLVVISDSLGSKIVFDAIYNMTDTKDKEIPEELHKAGQVLFGRTRGVFLRANQIPILGLADQRVLPVGTTRVPNYDAQTGRDFQPDPLKALIDRDTTRANAAAKPPIVVAFSDPNDLLSYVLSQSSYNSGAFPIVDVWVSNASALFGLIELPNKAHLDYEINDDVLGAIVCGRPKSNYCR